MNAPLSTRMRPRSLEQVRGQSHLLETGGILSQLHRTTAPTSLVLWGPPGCGKTSLARLIASQYESTLFELSAVFDGVKRLREVIELGNAADGTACLFVDEIHRWSKTQQDALLPHLERGRMQLIGATTEPPRRLSLIHI